MAVPLAAPNFWFNITNLCDFPVYYNLTSGSVNDRHKLIVNDAILLIPTNYIPLVSNGSFVMGKDRNSPGLTINWGYDASGTDLHYSLALENGDPWDFLKYHNELDVLNADGTKSSCYSYDCEPGYSKCYWSQEYPAAETCSKPQYFNATLCL